MVPAQLLLGHHGLACLICARRGGLPEKGNREDTAVEEEDRELKGGDGDAI